MYRIKNKDKFKELLKYGYEECENKYTKKVMKDTNKAWTYYETIEISKDDGIIRTRLYQDCADQEWVGYIEKKERFIYDLDEAGLLEEVNIKKLDDVKAKAFCELRKENEELKQQHEFAIRTLQKEHTEQIEGLKNTIVRMSINLFSSQDSFMTVFKNIDNKLGLILGGKK
jgi:hypothetical protein|nr:MAG TPA: hypothetical protein [Caudoviricetes sp.]